MGYQLGSPRLREIFESAYRGYKTQTGVRLATHPFAQRLEYPDSAMSITTLLQVQGHVPAFRDPWQSDRMMGSIESIVYDSCMLSTTVALGDAIGLVRQVLIGCYEPLIL